MSEIDKVIAAASREGIVLRRSDLQTVDGDLFLDGMDPYEWLQAMTMD